MMNCHDSKICLERQIRPFLLFKAGWIMKKIYNILWYNIIIDKQHICLCLCIRNIQSTWKQCILWLFKQILFFNQEKKYQCNWCKLVKFFYQYLLYSNILHRTSKEVQSLLHCVDAYTWYERKRQTNQLSSSLVHSGQCERVTCLILRPI